MLKAGLLLKCRTESPSRGKPVGISPKQLRFLPEGTRYLGTGGFTTLWNHELGAREAEAECWRGGNLAGKELRNLHRAYPESLIPSHLLMTKVKLLGLQRANPRQRQGAGSYKQSTSQSSHRARTVIPYSQTIEFVGHQWLP